MTQTCADCGNTFTPARADAAYCSSACRQRAYRNRNAPSRNGSPSTARPARCAAVAIPGIAVVELPEPAEAVRCWPVVVGGEPESLYLAGDEVIVSGSLRLYANESRDLAAALIAAADYAERDQ